MFFGKRKKITVGTQLYEVTLNNTIAEWVVEEVIKNHGRYSFKLVREDSQCFCVMDDYSLGKNLFLHYADAVKERSRRTL